MKKHGGARPGAGRPPKDRTPQEGEVEIQNAQHYLELVVTGKIAADSLRIQAARSLLAYQRPKQRAPVASPQPKELARRAEKEVERAAVEEFERKASIIRAKYAAKRNEKCQ